MAILLATILLICAGLVFIPVMLLFVQIICAVLASKHSSTKISTLLPRPRIAVIVPAHNEALGISQTLNSILPQLSPEDRLVVVADNCTDNTAAVARKLQVIVLERSHATQRGKGFALDYAMQYLTTVPPDVVIIIDADCEISEQLIAEISQQCLTHQRPVQANYQMRFPTRGGTKQQIMEFAWLVKNTVRPKGYQYLGLPCQLMGTGMAFPWQTLAQTDLANGHLVEDMKLGLDLAKTGSAPYFCDTVTVKSYFPTTAQGLATQRMRWEHGHLGLIKEVFPRYLSSAIRQKNGMLLAQLLDLAVPPLALLLMLASFVWAFTGLFAWYGDIGLAFYLITLALSLLGLGILIAWYCFARNMLSLQTLLMAPWVLLMKIPIYVKFLVSRQVDWVRSKRDHD